MKKVLLFVAAMAVSLASVAQSIAIYKGSNEVVNMAPGQDVSIVFSSDPSTNNLQTSKRQVEGTWCSVGTSITWYNNNVGSSGGRFTRGYQDRVMDKLEFDQLLNVGDNGGCVARSVSKPVKADYYTIEHGINDWGHSVKVGTIDDYINNTNNGTFAADYRRLIDNIYKLNPKAKVVLCTPRKAYGFSSYLPDHWYDAKNGIYLSDYAELIRQIAEYESLPVADFFAECGGQHNLDQLSIDVALHPNDDGYQMMANVLVKAFEKIIVK